MEGETRVFEVLVTEYLQRRVKVKARSPKEAERIAEADWENASLVLSVEDSQGAEFFCEGEGKPESEAGSEGLSDWEDYK